MRIVAQDKDGMTLYAQWYSTDGKCAMNEKGEIIDLERSGYKLLVVDDNYFEVNLKSSGEVTYGN